MKRILTAALTVIMLLIPAAAEAKPYDLSDSTNLFSFKFEKTETPKPAVAKKELPKPKPTEPPAPMPVVHTVVKGDTLSNIGTATNVEWQRLWAKNTQLGDPDVLKIGDQITIPLPSEALSRDLPAGVALPTQTPSVAPLQSFDGGNTYDYGYCTWYVKSRRGASLPNRLGNANTWYARAASLGMSVGPTPRAGAVGATTRGSMGHVVYVESVNADGTVNISEMNYNGWGVQSFRTTSASEFNYIY